MSLHIGREIELKYQESGIKLSEFAKRLNTGRRNVYSIFGRQDISSDMLRKISEILNYNFFELYEQELKSLPRTSAKVSQTARLSVVVDLDGTKQTLDKWIRKLTTINGVVN